MFYRTAAIFIVLFWLTMTALLVHREIRPSDSALREIPVSHVVKLLLMHQQESKLRIYSDKLALGQLSLRPKIDEKTEARNFAFSGDFQFIIPGARRERIAWRGDFEMDKFLNARKFTMDLTNRGASMTSHVEIFPGQNVALYELSSPGGLIVSDRYSLNEDGLNKLLKELNIDPAMLPIAFDKPTKMAPVVKARLSSLHVHNDHIDENMDTYLVTVELNGQELLACHVNELGEIVEVSTLLGYTLRADDTVP